MKRYDAIQQTEVERPDVDAFLNEIVVVCHNHGMSLSHEDSHGAFEVEAYDQVNIAWLLDAHIKIRSRK